MNETQITIVGRLADQPRLRRTEGGTSVLSMRVASTIRRPDRATGGWVDGESLFVAVTCWRTLAERVAVSLEKGDPVVVHGRLTTREYEQDGQRRSRNEVTAAAVGPDLALVPATLNRPSRERRGEGADGAAARGDGPAEGQESPARHLEAVPVGG